MTEAVEITEEDLARALEADRAANVASAVAKASAGQPLTAKERALIEEERNFREKARQPVFTLEGAGAPSPLERLTQEQLAVRWAYSPRQIKNWIHDGRVANDSCPLTRPEEMAAWFERVYAPRKCPARLRQAVHSIQLDEEVKVSEPEAPPAPVPIVTVSDSEKGLLAMLERLRVAEATLHAKYLAHVEAGNEKQAAFVFGEWSKITERLRAQEKSAPAALEAMGVYVRRDEVARELEPLHAAILQGFKQAFKAARVRLRAITDVMEWNAAVEEIADDAGRGLSESSFAMPLELALEVTT